MEQCVFMWHKTKRRRGYRDSSTSGRLIVTWEDGPGRLGVTEESPEWRLSTARCSHFQSTSLQLNYPSPLKQEKGEGGGVVSDMKGHFKGNELKWIFQNSLNCRKSHASVKTDMLAAQICALS